MWGKLDKTEDKENYKLFSILGLCFWGILLIIYICGWYFVNFVCANLFGSIFLMTYMLAHCSIYDHFAKKINKTIDLIDLYSAEKEKLEKIIEELSKKQIKKQYKAEVKEKTIYDEEELSNIIDVIRSNTKKTHKTKPKTRTLRKNTYNNK